MTTDPKSATPKLTDFVKNVERIPEYFAKPEITEGLAEVHPVLLVRQMANEILRQRRELADCRAELERGCQQLEIRGVPRERAKSIGNGIDVLATRYEKESRLAAHTEREESQRGMVMSKDGLRVEANIALPAPSAASGLAEERNPLQQRWPMPDVKLTAEWVKGERQYWLDEAARNLFPHRFLLRVALCDEWLRSHQAPVGEERNEIIEECASVVWDGTEPPPDTWVNVQTGKPAFDPIQVNRMFLAQRLRALKTPSSQTGGGS